MTKASIFNNAVTLAVPTTAIANRPLVLVLSLSLALCGAVRLEGGELPFAGVRALLIQPERPWRWDSSLQGVLEQRGIDVTWGEPAALEDEKALGQYDLVATTTKRRFTPDQVRGLRAYVRAGGALYGSWGGPMNCRKLLELCGIERARTVDVKELALAEGPLANGLGQRHWQLPRFVGHRDHGDDGCRLVAIESAGGTVVARDAEGNSLGVIHQCGRGRTAVLGFAIERTKDGFRSIRDASVVTDNLLHWLVPNGPRLRASPGTIQVNLPARADVRGVWADGELLDKPRVRARGSLKQITVDVRRVATGAKLDLRVRYAPLAKARNIETFIHMPGTLRHFATPAEAVEYVASFNPTIVQPLLRGRRGSASYRGMPEDTPDPKIVTDYPGDYLAEFVDGCHRRGIKVIGGVYFAFPKPLRKAHPDADCLGKDGKPDPERRVCFNRPEVQDYNFRTVEQLLDNYALDGLILDDNFELDKRPCYCDYCKTQFRAYCRQRGAAYQDPAVASDQALQTFWLECKREATLALARRVRAIAAAHGVPAGGWVKPDMEPTYLAAAFDFLGGMGYSMPASLARGPLSVLGDRGYMKILWGPDREPADLEAEAVEAIRAGCSSIGFWILAEEGRTPKHDQRTGSFAAIARALRGAESHWLAYYRDNLITGDARFVVTEASLSREELKLTVKNLGRQAKRRLECPLDLSAVEYSGSVDVGSSSDGP